jgi:glucose-1-phosphate thymidylyltransferase
MKGVILAGGTGSRLNPMTRVTNKHLLPVYHQPMIMYPLDMLIRSGLKDIMIVSGKGHAGHFLELLGSGNDLGIRLSYAVQEKAGGIAEALALAEDFADDESIAVALGDNIYEHDQDVGDFTEGARIFVKKVDDPERFGVAEVADSKVQSIEEKPQNPKSNYAVSGFYIYDNSVFSKITQLTPSSRGEYEITDVNNMYIADKQMEARFVEGFWTDAGTIESLYRAATLVKNSRLANNAG